MEIPAQERFGRDKWPSPSLGRRQRDGEPSWGGFPLLQDSPWAGAAGGELRGLGSSRSGLEGLELQEIRDWGIAAMCRTVWGGSDESRAFPRLFSSSAEPRGILADLSCN